MGDPEGWPQPSGLLPEGSSALFSSLDDERWVQAENRTVELITRIQPTKSSEVRRRAVADHVQRLIRKCFDCEVFTFGSVPLKTYLPDGDIDLTTFTRQPHLKESWANEVRSVLEAEERNKDAEFRVKEVQYIQAEVKIIKCLVENIVVDISFNQLGGLCTLCFLEEVDRLIGQDHLFKRSIILVKAWCYYESRILGAHHGLISTYALETLVLYIFHVFHASLRGPLGVLFRFLEFFSNFDWDKYCISLWGPIPLSTLPEMPPESPRKDGGQLLLTKAFLEACARAYAVLPNGNTVQSRAFGSKYLNVVDPLRTTNNLGRSVSKGNFFRIRSAFSFGAKKLARILECPMESVIDELDKFFLNTWDRHGSGKRPDAPEYIERLTSPDEPGEVSTEGEKVTSTLAGELLKELNTFAVQSQHTVEVSREAVFPNSFRSLALQDKTADVGIMNHAASGNSVEVDVLVSRQRRSEDTDLSRHRKRSEDRRNYSDHDCSSTVTIDPPAKAPQPSSSTLGTADVPPFYPRSAPVHSETEDVPTTSKQDGSSRFSRSNHLPVLGPPPPPPLNIHPTSHAIEGSRSFGPQAFLPMPRGPVPPPLPPPYGRSGMALQQQRVIENEVNHHSDDIRQERTKPSDAEQNRYKVQVPAFGQPNSSRNGSKELSPDAAIFYEQNGAVLDEDEAGIGWQGKVSGRTFSEDVAGKIKAVDELLESRRATDGAAAEAWPVSEAAVYQYSQSSPLVYTGLSPPGSYVDNTVLPPASPSSGASSPASYSLHPQRVTAAASQPPSIGIPVSPGFLRPSSSDTTVSSRKQRPVDSQAAVPSFYYSPFPYVPMYSSFPFYVLPPEEGDSLNKALQDDGQTPLIFGVGERLSAAGIPASASGRHNAEDGQETQFDLLTSDFANHLRNLDYGRACQGPGPMFLQPTFPPFAKELQGHYIWEGPGRPVQGNMKQHGSRFPRTFQRSFPAPPGFSGEDVSKGRTGTGTYLPGPRYREKQYKGQNDGYQEQENAERETSSRYQRSVSSRGQNNNRVGGGKPGDKVWHESFNRNSVHGASDSGILTGMNLEAYPPQAAAAAYMNGNGSSQTGPLFVVYPSSDVAALEFGSVGVVQGSEHHGAVVSRRAVTHTGHDRQQQQLHPSSPKNNNQQRPQQQQQQRSYQMKDEDFPPLSFRAQGQTNNSSSSSGGGSGATGSRSSPFQTYVASQS